MQSKSLYNFFVTLLFKYSIIIPTYNHCKDLLEPCINSVLRYTNMTNVELVVSANGCVDNTWDYLQGLKQQFASIGMSDHLQYPKNRLLVKEPFTHGVKISSAG